MKIFVYLFFLLYGIKSLAQDNRVFNYCPIDENTDLELKISIYNDYLKDPFAIKTLRGIIKKQPEFQSQKDDACLGEYDLKWDHSIGKFLIYQSIYDSSTWVNNQQQAYYHDSIIQYLNPDKVKRLSIECNLYFGDPDSIKSPVYQLNKEPIFKNLFMDSLQELRIHQNYSNFPIEINLTQWSSFKSLKNNKTLEKLDIQVNCFDKHLIEDIEQIQSLKFLNYYVVLFKKEGVLRSNEQQPPISTYAKLKNLEKLNTNNLLFNHQLTQLKHFKGFDNEVLLTYQSEAKKVFFSEQLAGGGLYYINYVNSLIGLKMSQFTDSSGKTVIFAKDLFTFDLNDNKYESPYYFETLDDEMISLRPMDTIATGELRAGKPVGEWCYQKSKNTTKNVILYNHVFHEKTIFPENGPWKYNYSNGQLAIEGQFKHGKKTGEWKFYTQEGKLGEIEHYKNDLPHGLFIINQPSLISPYQHSRTYYKRNGTLISYNKTADDSFVTYADNQLNFYTIPGKNLEIWENVKMHALQYNSPKYKSYLYSNCYKYLFPELSKKEVMMLIGDSTQIYK